MMLNKRLICPAYINVSLFFVGSASSISTSLNFNKQSGKVLIIVMLIFFGFILTSAFKCLFNSFKIADFTSSSYINKSASKNKKNVVKNKNTNMKKRVIRLVND